MNKTPFGPRINISIQEEKMPKYAIKNKDGKMIGEITDANSESDALLQYNSMIQNHDLEGVNAEEIEDRPSKF